MYRDDLEAAHARIEALEHDLAETRRRLAEAKRDDLQQFFDERRLAAEQPAIVEPLPRPRPEPQLVSRREQRRQAREELPAAAVFGGILAAFVLFVIALCIATATSAPTGPHHRFHSSVPTLTETVG